MSLLILSLYWKVKPGQHVFEVHDMDKDPQCLFCRIIAGEIPCAKVYEDEDVFAFLDINPLAPGHTLVLPKRHSANILELPDEDDAALLSAIRKIGRAIMDACGAEGFHVLQNNFPAAGQTVFHTHFHLIPRKEGDGYAFPPQGSYPDQSAMLGTAESIASAIGA